MIIITGASNGIGKYLCEQFAREGQKVVGISRTGQKNSSYENIQADVSDFDALKNIARSLDTSGTENLALINCAGVASMNLALMTPPRIVEKIINTNLLGTIYSCQAFVPLMVKRSGGTIINFSTIATAIGLQGESIYAASKAGVEAFSRISAKEFAPFGIGVHCLAPGPIKTDLISGVPQQKIQEIVNLQAIKKMFTTEDIFSVVKLLLTDPAKSITGQVLNLGGI